MKVVVIGGGVLGSMHAWHAVQRGHEVVQIERDLQARSASVRNFGLVWVSGRAGGEELTVALRARELWEEIGGQIPDLDFRPNGSLTIALTDAELKVAAQAMDRPDAADRGFELLSPEQVREVNPALLGESIRGGLWCRTDAAVEPRTAQQAIRSALSTTDRFTYLAGREVVDLADGRVVCDTGEPVDGDAVIYAPGAALSGLTRRLFGDTPVRRVYLQMVQTAPYHRPLTTSVADADSFRYYPGFAGTALDDLNANQPQHPVAAQHHMQLLMVQRSDGGLTVGDTHVYDEPFPFDVDEAPTAYLLDRVEQILGTAPPAVQRRWYGVYAQCLDPAAIVHRQLLDDRTCLVTGPGGRGMTLSPAIAEQTCDQLSL